MTTWLKRGRLVITSRVSARWLLMELTTLSFGGRQDFGRRSEQPSPSQARGPPSILAVGAEGPQLMSGCSRVNYCGQENVEHGVQECSRSLSRPNLDKLHLWLIRVTRSRGDARERNEVDNNGRLPLEHTGLNVNGSMTRRKPKKKKN